MSYFAEDFCGEKICFESSLEFILQEMNNGNEDIGNHDSLYRSIFVCFCSLNIIFLARPLTVISVLFSAATDFVYSVGEI